MDDPALVIRRSAVSLWLSKATISFVMLAAAMITVAAVSWNVRAGVGSYQQTILFGVSALSLGAIVVVVFAATLWWVRQRKPLAVIGDGTITITRTGATLDTDAVTAVRLWTATYPGKTVHYAEFIPAGNSGRRSPVAIGSKGRGTLITDANDRLTVEMPAGTRPTPEDLANQLRHLLPHATVTTVRARG